MGLLEVFRRPGATKRLKLMAVFNSLAPLYFLTMTFTATGVALFVTFPEIYKHSAKTLSRHYAALVYVFTNVMWNYIMTVRTDTSVRNLPREVLDYHEPKNSRPYRCHSCKLCNACIVKRDHHCFFMNTCVGYYNQKYFMWYCIHMFFGTCYSVVTSAMYTSRVYGTQFTGVTTFIVLGPSTVFNWWFKNTPTGELSLVVLMYLSLTAGIVCLGFFLWEMWLATVGLTTFEAVNDLEGFDRGLWSNLSDVLGKKWVLGALFPIPLSQCGNGIYGNKFGEIDDDGAADQGNGDCRTCKQGNETDKNKKTK